ncbi:MAG: hypothetical protein QM749_11075 [Aquabacterium sp.]
MLKFLIPIVAAMAALSAPAAQARPAFTGTDFSGVYDCKGNDEHDGEYKGAVTLKLVPERSLGDYGAYTLSSDVPGLGTYAGYAAVQGTHLSMYFGLTAPDSKDYGTGIASFAKGKGGKWTFHLYYFEPAYNGGNYGLEDCVRR